MARYGLPEVVTYCKLCVISNQRPSSTVEYSHTIESNKETIDFDSDGICSACKVGIIKKDTDWIQREVELYALLDLYRSESGNYDCIVPGSGGKDSFYAAHVLKYKYGMHPLTVTWSPHLYTDWGRRNWDRWLAAGFDNVLVTPNPQVHRLLTRLAVENLFHPFQPFIIGQKSLAAKMSVLYQIPLVFYGEDEAEYGNLKSLSSKRDSSFHSVAEKIHLGGVSLEDLKSKYSLTDSDLSPYLPLTENLTYPQIHYLGYYLKWKPQECYYYAVENGGFEPSPERTPGTYSKYNSIDDKIDDFHYWTTYQKFGIGRATYDAAQEIRSGDILRSEGIALVHRFDGEWPSRFAMEVNEYLSVPGFEKMTDERWLELARKFRSSHLWDGDRLRFRVE